MTAERTVVGKWLQFELNPAAYLHESYRDAFLPRAPRALRDKLWGQAFLSRYLHREFDLQIEPFPSIRNEGVVLSVWLRLVMIEPLEILLTGMGLCLSAHSISASIDRKHVEALRKGLGEKWYSFATGVGGKLFPQSFLPSPQKEDLSSIDFHTRVGLALLLRQAQETLSEQQLRRLALKCPRGVVETLRSERNENLGYDFRLDPKLPAEKMWQRTVKEVVPQWHAWLASSPNA